MSNHGNKSSQIFDMRKQLIIKTKFKVISKSQMLVCYNNMMKIKGKI